MGFDARLTMLKWTDLTMKVDDLTKKLAKMDTLLKSQKLAISKVSQNGRISLKGDDLTKRRAIKIDGSHFIISLVRILLN